MPQTFPCAYSAAPIKKYWPSFPNGRQFATRAVTLPPPGRPLNISGVSRSRGSSHRNPHPCALMTNSVQRPPNGFRRSRLITLTGISTRTRVLRRPALDVRISIAESLSAKMECTDLNYCFRFLESGDDDKSNRRVSLQVLALRRAWRRPAAKPLFTTRT